jgi:hypothetical protein
MQNSQHYPSPPHYGACEKYFRYFNNAVANFIFSLKKAHKNCLESKNYAYIAPEINQKMLKADKVKLHYSISS